MAVNDNPEGVYLVQSDEGGNANVLFFEEGNTFLSCVNGVHHNVVQCTTTGGDCHIILLIYGSQVSLQGQQKDTFNMDSLGGHFGLTIKCVSQQKNQLLNCCVSEY